MIVKSVEWCETQAQLLCRKKLQDTLRLASVAYPVDGEQRQPSRPQGTPSFAHVSRCSPCMITCAFLLRGRPESLGHADLL